MYTCPKGHQSADGDYCDVCGAPIAGASAPSAVAGPSSAPSAAGSTAAAPSAASAGSVCPQCQAPATGRFCEVCGYDILMASLSPAAPTGHHASGFATGAGPATTGPATGSPTTGSPTTGGPTGGGSSAPPAWPPAPATPPWSPASTPAPDPAPAAPPPPVPDPVAATPDAAVAPSEPAVAAPDPAVAAPESAVAAPVPVVPDVAPPAPTAPAAVAAPDPDATADVPAFVPDPDPLAAIVPEALAAPEAPVAPAPVEWRLLAGADAAYHARMLAEAEPGVEPIPMPAYVPERRFELSGPQALIGRQSKSRGIQPEIDLSGPHADPAVSHSHALLIARPDGGWAVVDLDSSNGTYVNDAIDPIDPNVPVPLSDGDRIHVGAWTTLTLQAGPA